MLKLDGQDIGHGGAPVLSDVRLSVRPGERVALLGRSGSGKSTLLGALHRAMGDRRVALVPQDTALVPQLSALRNVLMGRLDDHGAIRNLATLIRPRRADRDAALAVLARVGLTPEADRAVEGLSGGQQQRVGLARAIFRGGEIILGDEPMSAVDPIQAEVLAQEIRAAFPTAILALHDVGLAHAFATRVIGLRHGRILIDAPIADLDAATVEELYAR
ncbi:ATP-binding cassette domain-containing protein [Paracoccus sp. 1_MG-2023]|uniref:ATP-binding cassette domain-containing protein n=1 Tax=unclassified Paracoccus (in: a-proteobacteria) TaxID=2688777 RepID=UPI001C08CA87|nr:MULTISPECIES: ATP-binding cassette domain-containing protein [unclassified Paracoccus (in: a-proteobacteria)]MBU2957756.1 ATP-binding cassette domain-containing protein [Paracoccus sp. C2R09]MDO6667396.1 ATP-binding cassette domain-containing protein [Paracoccus sp. 1_MG-2023]